MFMALLHQWLSIWDDWLRNKSHYIYRCPVLNVNSNNTVGHKSGKLIAHLLPQMPQPSASPIQSLDLNTMINREKLKQRSKNRAYL